jgi:hypothetical protein
MKLIILRFNTAIKPSPLSKGVMEIQINNQPCKGIKLTTCYTRAWRAPRVAIVHDDYQRVEPGPPYPSARLPRDTTLRAIRARPMHYPLYHPRGMIGYLPT